MSKTDIEDCTDVVMVVNRAIEPLGFRVDAVQLERFAFEWSLSLKISEVSEYERKQQTLKGVI